MNATTTTTYVQASCVVPIYSRIKIKEYTSNAFQLSLSLFLYLTLFYLSHCNKRNDTFTIQTFRQGKEVAAFGTFRKLDRFKHGQIQALCITTSQLFVEQKETTQGQCLLLRLRFSGPSQTLSSLLTFHYTFYTPTYTTNKQCDQIATLFVQHRAL